jgi:thiol-disulfide isomerase/thioredoxin
MTRVLALVALLLITFTTHARRTQTPKAGVWRFELQYPNVAVPFLMELEPGKKGWNAVLINGKERLELDPVVVQKGKWIIHLQTYQNYLEFSQLSPSKITGHFVKPNKSPEERIPLVGYPGTFRRFDRSPKKAEVNLSGQWAMEITESDGKKVEAIALFDQSGNTLHASIMTPTGDYRYIDGYVSGSNFETGAFDGVYNFVFKGALDGKNLKGEIAAKTIATFTAKRDDKARLPDPLKQTQVEAIDFTFPDLNGKNVSLKDFAGRPVIIQIFGSWCPNCIDELGFLGPWYEKNKKLGVEIVALSFERALGPEDALKHLKKVALKRAIPYPVLLAGTSSADSPANKLPGIKNFISFPTTIFLDKNHKVHKVHAGFNGPGTGMHYMEFQKMFNATIEELTK